MTRFARAKGSKASNERREEEATPWHVMRQQLAEQLSNYNNQVQSGTHIQSYNLKEILGNGAQTQKEEVWHDFSETKSNRQNQLKSNIEKNEIKERNNNDENVETLSRRGGIETNVYLNKDNFKKHEGITIGASGTSLSKDRKLEKKLPLQLKDKRKQKDPTKTNVSKGTKLSFGNMETSSDNFMKKEVENSCGTTIGKLNSTKKRKSKNEDEPRKIAISKTGKNKCFHRKNVFVETPIEPKYSSVEYQGSAEKSMTTFENVGSPKEHENHLTEKKKQKKVMISSRSKEINITEDKVEEVKKPEENDTNIPNNSLNKKQSSNSNKNNTFKSNKQKQLNYSINNSKPYRSSDNPNIHENHYRQNNFSNYPNRRNFQTIIANGREIHVVKFQGFLVKKDDAEELKKLRKTLLHKNIPKEKLETIIKLERRKAEKALAREKKKVCYNCRQFGHNFSDCPEIKESDMVKTGVCFKCGSLEHSHFECKVLQQQEFRHAVCFICRDQGHIARQCPLNSQGLYPKGGGCHLCGEVTHLRKDCPKAVEEKTSTSVTVETLKDSGVEDIGSMVLQQRGTEINKKKVIKFK